MKAASRRARAPLATLILHITGQELGVLTYLPILLAISRQERPTHPGQAVKIAGKLLALGYDSA